MVDLVAPTPERSLQGPPAPRLLEAGDASPAEPGSPTGQLVANVKGNLSGFSPGEADQFGRRAYGPAAHTGALGDVGHRSAGVDIDAPAGQPGHQPGVAAAATDGE